MIVITLLKIPINRKSKRNGILVQVKTMIKWKLYYLFSDESVVVENQYFVQ